MKALQVWKNHLIFNEMPQHKATAMLATSLLFFLPAAASLPACGPLTGSPSTTGFGESNNGLVARLPGRSAT